MYSKNMILFNNLISILYNLNSHMRQLIVYITLEIDLKIIIIIQEMQMEKENIFYVWFLP